MDKFLETVEKIWNNSFVQALVYLVIAFVAAGLASFIVKKLCKLLKLDAKLDKWGVNEGQVGTSIKFIGKLVYLVVFLLFLPAALNALGLEGVSDPITGFASTCINYIPNIIAALVLIFVGVFLGQIVAQIVTVLLAKTKIDNLTQKLGSKNETLKISGIVGKVVLTVIVLVMIVQALTVLGIEAISAPAITIINAVFGAIPSILLAVAVVAIGLFVANIVCNLLGNVLTAVGFDGVVSNLVPNAKIKFSATKIVVNTVRTVIVLFIAAQGIEVLGLTTLSSIAAAVIAYLPMIVKALVIALVAFFGANFLESFINKTMPAAKNVGKIVKVMIFVVATFMILSQLDFATTIVNSAFIIILCALAVAFAISFGIAFGIGGKDFAKKTLDNIKCDKKDEDNK